MVSVKNLLLATSILFSGAIAVPFPATELSATEPVQSRAVADYAIGTHDLNPAAVVDIEARKTKSKSKTKSKTKSTSTSNTSKTKDTGKTKDTKSKSCSVKKKTGSTSSTKKTTRGINDNRLTKNKDHNAIEEHEFVTDLKAGEKASVTELSGCTAVFFWDQANVPSIFHIFCGKETADGYEVMEMMSNKNIKETWIISQDVAHANLAKAGMMKFWEEYCDEAKEKEWENKIKIKESYDKSKTANGSKLRWKLTVTAGKMDVDRALVEGRQLQQQKL